MPDRAGHEAVEADAGVALDHCASGGGLRAYAYLDHGRSFTNPVLIERRNNPDDPPVRQNLYGAVER